MKHQNFLIFLSFQEQAVGGILNSEGLRFDTAIEEFKHLLICMHSASTFNLYLSVNSKHSFLRADGLSATDKIHLGIHIHTPFDVLVALIF